MTQARDDVACPCFRLLLFASRAVHHRIGKVEHLGDATGVHDAIVVENLAHPRHRLIHVRRAKPKGE